MSSEPRCYSLELKNTKEKLKLTNLSIEVVITGFLAKTAVTMTFFNETDHDGVEGELVFPMAEGSVLGGYAIDINGELVEGVVVEKEKARQVFETEARKEVSHKPTASIAEHVVGNVFKTRVFPIPKRAPRTIRVTTVEELDAQNTFYLLLDQGKQAIDNYHFSVQVDSQSAAAPKIWDGLDTTPRQGRLMAALELAKQDKDASKSKASSDSQTLGRTRYRERFTSSNAVSPKGCIVYLPPSSDVVIVEPNETNTEYYFVVGGTLSSFASIKPPVGSDFDVTCNRVGIVWDTSASRKTHDKKVDMEIVKLLAQKLGKNAKLDFIPFADAMGQPVTLTMTGNTHTDNSAIERHLNDLKYDGGTNLSSLKLSKGPTFEHTTDTYAYYCLFTDGMHNMSTKSMPDVLEAPVYIFASSAESNTSLLKILSRKSGGEYFKFTTSSNTSQLKQAVDGLGAPVFSFLGFNIDSTYVREVYPSIPTRVDNVFRFSGRLSLEPTGEADSSSSSGSSGAASRSSSTSASAFQGTFVTLNFGFGSKVVHSLTCQLKVDNAAYTSLIPRFWAQKKIDELALFPEEKENEKIILDLGRKFSIVTPSTSIIVLEELEQYLKHDIEPPVALHSIRTKWLAIMQERAMEAKAKTEEKITSVLTLWNRRTAWWNEDLGSEEVQEKSHMHFMPFGDGVDLISRTLASQWIDWDLAHAPPPGDSSSSSSSDSDYSSYDEADSDDDDDEDDDEHSRGSSSGTGSGSDSENESLASYASSSSSSSDEEYDKKKKVKKDKKMPKMERRSSPPTSPRGHARQTSPRRSSLAMYGVAAAAEKEGKARSRDAKVAFFDSADWQMDGDSRPSTGKGKALAGLLARKSGQKSAGEGMAAPIVEEKKQAEESLDFEMELALAMSLSENTARVEEEERRSVRRSRAEAPAEKRKSAEVEDRKKGSIMSFFKAKDAKPVEKEKEKKDKDKDERKPAAPMKKMKKKEEAKSNALDDLEDMLSDLSAKTVNSSMELSRSYAASANDDLDGLISSLSMESSLSAAQQSVLPAPMLDLSQKARFSLSAMAPNATASRPDSASIPPPQKPSAPTSSARSLFQARSSSISTTTTTTPTTAAPVSVPAPAKAAAPTPSAKVPGGLFGARAPAPVTAVRSSKSSIAANAAAVSASAMPPPPPPPASMSAMPPPPPPGGGGPPPPPPGYGGAPPMPSGMMPPAGPPPMIMPPAGPPPMMQQQQQQMQYPTQGQRLAQGYPAPMGMAMPTPLGGMPGMAYPTSSSSSMAYPSVPANLPAMPAFGFAAPPMPMPMPKPPAMPPAPPSMSMPRPAPPPPPAAASAADSPTARNSLLDGIRSGSSLRKAAEAPAREAKKEAPSKDMMSVLSSALSRRSTIIDDDDDESDDEDDNWEEEGDEDAGGLGLDLFGDAPAAEAVAFDSLVSDNRYSMVFDDALFAEPVRAIQLDLDMELDSYMMKKDEAEEAPKIARFQRKSSATLSRSMSPPPHPPLPQLTPSSVSSAMASKQAMPEKAILRKPAAKPSPTLAVPSDRPAVSSDRAIAREIYLQRRGEAPTISASKNRLGSAATPTNGAPPPAPSVVAGGRGGSNASRGGSFAGRGRGAPTGSVPPPAPLSHAGFQQQQQQPQLRQHIQLQEQQVLEQAQQIQLKSFASLNSTKAILTPSSTSVTTATSPLSKLGTATGRAGGIGLGKGGGSSAALNAGKPSPTSRIGRMPTTTTTPSSYGSINFLESSSDTNEPSIEQNIAFNEYPATEPSKPSAHEIRQREVAEEIERQIAQVEAESLARRRSRKTKQVAEPYQPSAAVGWESLGTNTLVPYRAPHNPLEYAFYQEIDPEAPKEYSRDLTPAPEFPDVDWDSFTYANTPAAQSWKRWRQRHREQTWSDYEEKAFGTGEAFMDIFNRNRRLILQSRIQADFEAVEAENRKDRVLKQHTKVHERFRVKMSDETVPSVESWQLELELHTSVSSAYTQYLSMRTRPDLEKQTKFYMDAADYFFERLGEPAKAATILSNLAELELENPQFLRLIAFRLERAPIDPYLQVAIHVYRKVLAIRSEEPQSFRDLAMALTRRALYLVRTLEEKRNNPNAHGQANQSGAWTTKSTKRAMMLLSRPAYDRYAMQEERKVQAEIRALLEESIKLLNDVVLKKWDVRFTQVEVVALMDLNRVVAIVRSLHLEHVIGLSNLVDPRVIALHMPVDLRIQIQWDTDMTDVELSVIEPSGEKCNSIHNKTDAGGMMSRDFSHGYGPVEYLSRFAGNGHYTASIKLFHALEMKSGTTVLVRVWTDYGRPETEKEHFFIGRLNKAKQSLSVCDISVNNGVVITKV